MPIDAECHALAATIVGAGLGGLASAMLLACEGVPITIFESESAVGVRTRTIHTSEPATSAWKITSNSNASIRNITSSPKTLARSAISILHPGGRCRTLHPTVGFSHETGTHVGVERPFAPVDLSKLISQLANAS